MQLDYSAAQLLHVDTVSGPSCWAAACQEQGSFQVKGKAGWLPFHTNLCTACIDALAR